MKKRKVPPPKFRGEQQLGLTRVKNYAGSMIAAQLTRFHAYGRDKPNYETITLEEYRRRDRG